jgi:Domain of unknown function (DUF4331)
MTQSNGDQSRHSRKRVTIALGAVTALGAGAVAVGFGALSGLVGSSASSHREAPLISARPKVDNTDVYAFLSPDAAGTATLIANFYPNELPAGGPNFYQFDPTAHYDINIDTNGDAKANVIYRWKFHTLVRNKGTFLYNTGPVTSLASKNLNVVQKYSLMRWTKKSGWKLVAGRLRAAPSNVGAASMPDYAKLAGQATYTRGSTRTYAGQADDPFFLDLRVFDLLYGGDLSEVGNDSLAGQNVNTVALQIPVSGLGGANKVVGVWSTTSIPRAGGRFTQVSRLGSPLVNEVVIPLAKKDRWNASKPSNDGQFASYVLNPGLPDVVQAVYGIPAPTVPRNDLKQVFLTGIPGLNQPKHVTASEMLRLKLRPYAGPATPNRLGVIAGDNNGFPNGRRLADDVLDIALQVMEGELVGNPNDLGDDVNTNDVPFRSTFPYVALPHSGSTP